MSSDGRDIEGFMIVEFKDVEKADDMATDAAWRLKRDRVYVGLSLIEEIAKCAAQTQREGPYPHLSP